MANALAYYVRKLYSAGPWSDEEASLYQSLGTSKLLFHLCSIHWDGARWLQIPGTGAAKTFKIKTFGKKREKKLIPLGQN